jgi:hypothetical protein
MPAPYAQPVLLTHLGLGKDALLDEPSSATSKVDLC